MKTLVKRHTPTPWRLIEVPDQTTYTPGWEINVDGLKIAELRGSWGNREVTEEMEANAQLILSAVNSHEALLEAAKALLKSTEIRDCPDGRWSTADGENYRLRVRLEKAVEQAEGGKPQ